MVISNQLKICPISVIFKSLKGKTNLLNTILFVSDMATWSHTLAWARSLEVSAPCLESLWSPSQSPSLSPTSRGSTIKTRGRTRGRHRRWVTTKIWETLMSFWLCLFLFCSPHILGHNLCTQGSGSNLRCGVDIWHSEEINVINDSINHGE